MNDSSQQQDIHFKITKYAIGQGASDAKVIEAQSISIEDGYAKMCKEPHRCANYGRSANCPPFTFGPAGFRNLLKNYQYALVFYLEVPTEDLITNQRHNVMAWLQETAAKVERFSAGCGFTDSRGFAGGCCKDLFCGSFPVCRILKDHKECRNPDSARPSMSGFGINVAKMMCSAGWDSGQIVGIEKSDRPSSAYITGLVLLG